MSQTFGQYIRSLREKAGLTQRALSQAVGFWSLAHLSDIESGKRHPSRETLPKFADALGVTLDELNSRDVRSPIDAVKSLFAARPEMVAAFGKVVELAKTMDAEELVRRISDDGSSKSSPTPPVPKPVSAPTPPTSPAASPTPITPSVDALTPPSAPLPTPKPASDELAVEAAKKVTPEKNSRDDQPSLF